MKLLDGLFLYEIVMLGMGVLLFLLLSIAFIVLLVRSKPYGRLLPAFGLPIVMVGFPGIQSFEIGSDTFKIKTDSEAVLQDPTNQQARASLAAGVQSLAGRPIKDAATNLTIARAQIALGQIAQAEQKVDAVLRNAPQLAEAKQLKQRIELDRKLVSLSETLQRDAANAAAKAELARAVEQAAKVKIANPTTFTNLARAQAVLGQDAAATQSVNKALVIQPDFKDAVVLKERLGVSPAAAGARSP
jgi:tetratricopeptide (TPR) repeat protein